MASGNSTVTSNAHITVTGNTSNTKRSISKFTDSIASKPMAILKKKESLEFQQRNMQSSQESVFASADSIDEEASRHLDQILSESPKTDRFKYQKKSLAQPPSSPPRKGSGPLLDAYGVPVTTTTTDLNNARKKSRTNVGSADRIRVCVRKRPINSKELKRNEQDIAIVINKRQLTIQEPKQVPQLFN